jgi:osmotically-inducible protein OsmY
MGDLQSLLPRVVAGAILLAILGTPSIASAHTDAGIRQSIEEAAAQHTRLENTRFSVRVSGGEVVLFGQVRLYGQKLLLEQIAWRTAGVAAVDNEIRVEPRFKV